MAAMLLYPFIIVAGLLQALGNAMNAQLRGRLVNPWLTAMVSFLPIVFVFAALFFVLPTPLPTLDSLARIMDRFREAEGDVLVVDDDADARGRMRTMLERNGYTVVEAGDGREALDRVAHAVPRVILLDLTMPVMDGFAFLHALRERPGCGDVPVIVLTARDLTNADRTRLGEANQVLSKGQTSLRELAGELRSLAPQPVAHRASLSDSAGTTVDDLTETER